MEPGKELAEVVGADGEHERQADRRVDRVASADPVPEAEHVVRVDAERADLLLVGRDGHEVLPHGRLVAAETGQQPLPGRARVGQGLEGRERLRRDDEQRLGGVEVDGRLAKVGAVDVRDEPEAHRPVAVVRQRLGGHRGPQVRPADPDVDDVPQPLPGMTEALAVAHGGGECGHAVEGLVDLADHVDAVDDQPVIARHAQGDVQHRAVLGDVDVLAGHHPVPAFLDVRRARHVEQERQGVGGDALLRVVEEEPDRFERLALGALRIVAEEVAQGQVADRLVVGLERGPCRRVGDPDGGGEVDGHRPHRSPGTVATSSLRLLDRPVVAVKPAPERGRSGAAGSARPGYDQGYRCEPYLRAVGSIRAVAVTATTRHDPVPCADRRDRAHRLRSSIAARARAPRMAPRLGTRSTSASRKAARLHDPAELASEPSSDGRTPWPTAVSAPTRSPPPPTMPSWAASPGPDPCAAYSRGHVGASTPVAEARGPVPSRSRGCPATLPPRDHPPGAAAHLCGSIIRATRRLGSGRVRFSRSTGSSAREDPCPSSAGRC